MNVLHINCNYMSTALHQTMVEHMNKLGVNSIVFAPIYDERRSVIQPNSNVIVSKCFQKRDRYVFYYKQSKIIKALERNIKVSDYNCIHAYTLFTDGNAAYELSRKYNIPYVVAIRDTDVNVFFKYMFWMRKRGVKILQHASAIFFLSDTYRQHIFKEYIPEDLKANMMEKSYIIPNGIDDFWLNNLYVDRDNRQRIQDMTGMKLKVTYVGAISKRKNVSTTIKALKLLQNDGWDIEFTVAGGKENDEEYAAMQSFDGIKYLGKLKKEEIINCYRRNDIFIMPSKTETFGLTYAEAMSQGLPVIYTKGQGFDGQFEDGIVGYSVVATDEKEIVQSIKKIIANYSNMTQNCIKGVGKFDWNIVCKTYVELYDKILRSVL